MYLTVFAEFSKNNYCFVTYFCFYYTRNEDLLYLSSQCLRALILWLKLQLLQHLLQEEYYEHHMISKLIGTTAGYWSFCATSDGTFTSTLTLSEVIGATNKCFYAKASSSSTESPSIDTSVSVQVIAKVEITEW